MTYCLGIRTQAGIVLIADTRTNAGIDNISNFRKLHVLADGPDQLVFCASAGSLSTTQNMLALLEEGLDPFDVSEERRTVAGMASMFRVVSLVGEALMRANDPSREVEGYLALGLTDEAQTAAAILGHNYQANPFYQDSYALLAQRGLKPEAKGDGWLATIYRQVIKGEWL